MNTRNKPVMRKTRLALVTLIPSLILVLVATVPHTYADKPTTTALVTDKANLPVGSQFGVPDQIALTNSGNVYFTSGAETALFRWSGGTRTRLLQAGDPQPGFPGSVTEDFVAANLTVNSVGRTAMVNFFIQKGVRPSRGVFVYDGTSFNKVALSGEVAPGSGGNTYRTFNQTQINDSDQVAFRGRLEPAAIGPLGLFFGSPTSAAAKIALPGETAPGTGGGAFLTFQVIGINNSGQVAWISNITGGTTPRALFVGTPSSISKVAAIGDPAPGTAGTFAGLPNNPVLYFLNGNGDLAFATGVAGGGATTNGIWIGNGSGPPSKLMVNTDPTATALGGNFGGGIRVRGFNSAGKVLFQSNPDSGASSSHALFLKDLANPAQVAYARGQSAPGGTTELFDFTSAALLNDAGNVAFLSSLTGGPSAMGWFLGSGTAAPTNVALEGQATPIGGVYGLRGRQNGRLNSTGQVAFFADVIGPNQIGVFLFTPSGGTVSVVNTADTLPAGANSFVNASIPGASQDQLAFYAQKAGGRVNLCTKPLHSGNSGITRRIGEGDPAPGIGGALWDMSPGFGTLINSPNEVAIAAGVIGGSQYPAGGIFSHNASNGLQKIAATGDPAPGGGFFNGVFLAESRPRINSQGQVVFFADSFTGDFGIFIGSATGGVQNVVRSGDPSPIGPGTIVDFPLDVESNDVGQVALGITVQSPGPVFTNALVVGSGTSAPVKVIAEGDPGPGGGTVSSIHPFLKINNAGRVAYVVDLTGGTTPAAVLIGPAGGAQSTVAQVNDPAAGTGGGTFASFDDQTIEVNNPGQVAFFASIAGSIVTGGHFLGSASAAPAARLMEGQALPGGGSAGVITHFFGIMTLIDSGQMSVQVLNITGAPNLFRQVIISPTGVLNELVTDGQKAAGTGSTFGESVAAVPSTTQDRLVFSAVLVDGPAKFGIFSDK